MKTIYDAAWAAAEACVPPQERNGFLKLPLEQFRGAGHAASSPNSTSTAKKICVSRRRRGLDSVNCMEAHLIQNNSHHKVENALWIYNLKY